MQYFFFFDGNEKRIAWCIQTDTSKIEQKREHAEIYLDKVTKEQSKCIALHVGLFWGIGKYIFKNGDQINIMTDSKSIQNFLLNNETSSDEFIKKRIHFINQLISQRELKINLKLIEQEKNYVSKLI